MTRHLSRLRHGEIHRGNLQFGNDFEHIAEIRNMHAEVFFKQRITTGCQAALFAPLGELAGETDPQHLPHGLMEMHPNPFGMKIIAFIEEAAVLRKILENLRLWEEPEPRAPPPLPTQMDVEDLPFLDG